MIIAPHSYYKDKNGVLFGEQKSEFTNVDFYYILIKMTLNLTQMEKDYVIGNWYHRNYNSVTTRAKLFQFFLKKRSLGTKIIEIKLKNRKVTNRR